MMILWSRSLESEILCLALISSLERVDKNKPLNNSHAFRYLATLNHRSELKANIYFYSLQPGNKGSANINILRLIMYVKYIQNLNLARKTYNIC